MSDSHQTTNGQLKQHPRFRIQVRSSLEPHRHRSFRAVCSRPDIVPSRRGRSRHHPRVQVRYLTPNPLSNGIHKDRYSVDELKRPLEDVLNNPRLAAHVLKNHELTVNMIHESADTSGKRKRRRMNLPEPALEHQEVTALQRKLDAVRLKSWPYRLDSAGFLRGPRFTDLNPFTEPVCWHPSSRSVLSR